MAQATVPISFADRIHWGNRIKPALITLAIAAATYFVAINMVAPRVEAARPGYLPETFLSLPLGHVMLMSGETGTLLPVRLAETSTQRSVGFANVGARGLDNQFVLYVLSRPTTSRTSYSVRDVNTPIEFLAFGADGVAVALHASPLGANSVSVPEPHHWLLAAKPGSFERLGLAVGTTMLDPASIVKY